MTALDGIDGSNSSSDSYTITVKEKEAFSGDIKVTYDEPFVAGKPFPELKVESKGDGAKFLRAWFEISGAGTHRRRGHPRITMPASRLKSM